MCSSKYATPNTHTLLPLQQIPVRSRGWVLRGSKAVSMTPSVDVDDQDKVEPSMTVVPRPERSVYRLLLMTYFPSGFWSRLMSRMLGDDFIIEIVRSYFNVPKEATQDSYVISVLNRKAEWNCWQTGVALRYMDQVGVRNLMLPT